VEVDPDVLFTHGASLLVDWVTPSEQHSVWSRGAEAPLLHAIKRPARASWHR
jgi:hypothetical protein